MDIEKALELFEITNLASETLDSLKKRYRKLMIKYHPDNRGGDKELAASVSSAYSILKETFEKVDAYNRASVKHEDYNIVIPLSQLVKLYNGSKITLGNNSEKKEFSIKDIQKHGALIILDTTINHNGIDYSFTNVQRWSISDNYTINCDIFVENLNNDEKITVRLEDKVSNFSFTSQTISIKLSLSFNISVVIVVNKKIRANDKKRDV